MRGRGNGGHEYEIVIPYCPYLPSPSSGSRYYAVVHPPDRGDEWLGLFDGALPIGVIHDWVIRPQCGAVVVFSGTVRDHAEGRTSVTALTYEAYEEQAGQSCEKIAAEIRNRWPMVGRIVLLHRTGRLELGESSVVAAVSTPHRPEAFEAARFAIDALKASAPIWKQEEWSEGQDWGTGAQPIVDPADFRSGPTPSAAVER
jgi:molybdopterin synthase catalytic subunit